MEGRMSVYEDVLYEVKDGVALVTLNRPDSLNAFTSAMGQGLKRALSPTAKCTRASRVRISGKGLRILWKSARPRLQVPDLREPR